MKANFSAVENAIDKVRALQSLERATQTKTTRAQSEVIRSLSDVDLIEFAVRWKSEMTGADNDGNHK
jgi:hypothetical protein